MGFGPCGSRVDRLCLVGIGGFGPPGLQAVGFGHAESVFLCNVRHHPGVAFACTTQGQGLICAWSSRRPFPSRICLSRRIWGINNREAPLRLCVSKGLSPSSTNAELKSTDATCNVYLALAAAVVAGLEGIAVGRKLPDPVQVCLSGC
jgi:Glutamine synthetase, catalytic domain